MRIFKIIFCFAFVGIVSSVHAQKYFSKTGNISFFSATPIENIEAVSNSASTVFDLESGKIQWAVLIKSFEFEKALMQEHFNENYMESSEFPKAKYSGTLDNVESLDFNKDGNYLINTSGKLTIHGVTKEITAPVSFTVTDGAVAANCVLKVLVADYDIKIPSVVSSNIAEEIEIKINADYESLDK